MERSGAPTELEKPGEVRGAKPEDLMRFQPANTHRGLRPCKPLTEAGHMTASNRLPQHVLFSCEPGAIHTCDFSSTDNTRARSGGSTYSPTTSRSFSAKAWSVESLKRRMRCGFSPCAAQIFCTARG